MVHIFFNDPPTVTVKEEYLIYDYVGPISFVGGNLGIRVRLSFLSLGKVLNRRIDGGRTRNTGLKTLQTNAILIIHSHLENSIQ